MTQNLFQDWLLYPKEHFRKFFGDEASSQEVSERKTNRKRMYGKQNEENKRIYLEKNSN